MAKVEESRVMAKGGDYTQYLFTCPGCGIYHAPATDRPSGPNWTFNGNVDKPTFSPSLLVRWTKTSDGEPVDQVCHSFIRDGKIEFLSDCTHELAGQNIELPEVNC